MRVLVTGASGFVGQALLQRLQSDGHQISATSRSPRPDSATVRWSCVGNIGADTEWDAALAGVDAVVHLAARVHRIGERDGDPLRAYLRSNTEGTARLAECAAAAGVGRFVLLSSIKVNGEQTPPGTAFTVADPPQPVDPYAQSKWQAEQAVAAVCSGRAMRYTILRPPLVYGPAVKANMLRLLSWVSRGVPLPLAGIDNRRSLLYVGNLCDLIAICLQHPAAADRTLLVSDGEDLSTPELIIRLGRLLGRPARLLPSRLLPLSRIARWLGRGAEWQRLSGSLQIDSSDVTRTLGWQPPFTVDDGLRATCDWYNDRLRSTA